MSFFDFFSPFFIFWGSELTLFIVQMLCPTLILFTLVKLLMGGFFDV